MSSTKNIQMSKLPLEKPREKLLKNSDSRFSQRRKQKMSRKMMKRH